MERQVDPLAKIELTLHNRLQELDRIKDAIVSVLEPGLTPESAEFDMALVAEELFTNVIHYAYKDQNTHEIQMSLTATAEGWEITIEDDGLPFDPTAIPEPDVTVPLEDRPIGGLGIHLIRKMTDVFKYSRNDGKNIVRVGKFLKPNAI